LEEELELPDEPELPADGFAAGVLDAAGVLVLLPDDEEEDDEDDEDDEPESDDFEAPRESVR